MKVVVSKRIFHGGETYTDSLNDEPAISLRPWNQNFTSIKNRAWQISEILRRIVTGEALSDSQKHIFSMEQPFQSPPDLQLSSAHSAQSMCEITVGELTEEQKDSEVLSCCSVNIPPFDIDPIGTKHQNM